MSLWDTLVELYEVLEPIFALIGGLVVTLLAVVMGVIDGILSALGPFIEAVLDVGHAILEIIKLVCAVLKGDWSDAWEHMKNIASNIWSAICNIFIGIWEFIKGFGEGFVAFFEGIGVDILGIFQSIWEGICSVCDWIWDKITGLFTSIGDFFKNLWNDAFNWGKNLISNIGDGIEKAWDWVVDGVKDVGGAIADFLGFGSPTKKGPGHTADEWIPNLLGMMAEDMYAGQPMIERAAMSVASSLNVSSSANQAVVGTGTSPYGEMLNGLLQGLTATRLNPEDESKEIVLEIDGQRFARFIMPKLNKEYKRNGIVLKEG